MHGMLKSVFVDCPMLSILHQQQSNVKLIGDNKLLEPEIKWQFHLYPWTGASFWFHLIGR